MVRARESGVHVSRGQPRSVQYKKTKNGCVRVSVYIGEGALCAKGREPCGRAIDLSNTGHMCRV